MDRIQQLVHGGKKVFSLDLSGLRSNDGFREVIEAAKEAIVAYPENSVYSLANVDGILFDSETKRIIIQWMTFNQPYVRYGAVVGVDGIKKIMITSILKLTKRENVRMFATYDDALDWLKSVD